VRIHHVHNTPRSFWRGARDNNHIFYIGRFVLGFFRTNGLDPETERELGFDLTSYPAGSAAWRMVVSTSFRGCTSGATGSASTSPSRSTGATWRSSGWASTTGGTDAPLRPEAPARGDATLAREDLPAGR